MSIVSSSSAWENSVVIYHHCALTFEHQDVKVVSTVAPSSQWRKDRADDGFNLQYVCRSPHRYIAERS